MRQRLGFLTLCLLLVLLYHLIEACATLISQIPVAIRIIMPPTEFTKLFVQRPGLHIILSDKEYLIAQRLIISPCSLQLKGFEALNSLGLVWILLALCNLLIEKRVG